MLLEIPPGLTIDRVREALEVTGSKLRYVTASHLHGDHFDERIWRKLEQEFPSAEFLHPVSKGAPTETFYLLGGEPLWLVRAPKHSPSDTVIIFRGVAMTGDIELGTLDSVNEEVSRENKAASMDFLRGFEGRTGYVVKTVISAHLNVFRQGVSWPSLF